MYRLRTLECLFLSGSDFFIPFILLLFSFFVLLYIIPLSAGILAPLGAFVNAVDVEFDEVLFILFKRCCDSHNGVPSDYHFLSFKITLYQFSCNIMLFLANLHFLYYASLYSSLLLCSCSWLAHENSCNYRLANEGLSQKVTMNVLKFNGLAGETI